jgi:hypothetical protein
MYPKTKRAITIPIEYPKGVSIAIGLETAVRIAVIILVSFFSQYKVAAELIKIL